MYGENVTLDVICVWDGAIRPITVFMDSYQNITGRGKVTVYGHEIHGDIIRLEHGLYFFHDPEYKEAIKDIYIHWKRDPFRPRRRPDYSKH